ncbi:unnamed protein product [Cochlearia groenlandica]
MAERSFSQLPISLSHNSRRIINSRRGIFTVSEYWIPVLVFLCFFTLWFSHTHVNFSYLKLITTQRKCTTTHNKPHSQKETAKKKQRAEVVQGKVKRKKTTVKAKQSSAKAKETLAGETLTGE